MLTRHLICLHTLVRCQGSDVLKHVGEEIRVGRRDPQQIHARVCSNRVSVVHGRAAVAPCHPRHSQE